MVEGSIVDDGLRFDKCAGIYFRESSNNTSKSVSDLAALFVDKTNTCYQLLLEQGCDVNTTDASRSYSAIADGSRWYLNATLHGVKVCFLIDTGAEVSVLSRDVYKCFSRRVDKSIVGVRPVKTATGDKMRIYGKLLVDFKILGKVFVTGELMADVTVDGILVMDWLSRFVGMLYP